MLRLITKIKTSIFLTLIVIVAIDFVICSPTKDNGKENVCSTTCKEIASSILQNMDPNVSPCDNFYQFVCGNFTKNAVIPEDNSVNDIFTRINDQVQEQLKIIIEDGITDSDPQAFKLLQSYFKMCMNEEQVEKNSDNEFLEILKRLGGWPVLVGESWNESTFDWIESMYKFRETGYSFNYIIGFEILPDMKNNSKAVIYLDTSFGIDQEYLIRGLEQVIVKDYFKFMVDFAEIFGADRKQAEQELVESLKFEIELAKISLFNAELNATKLYNSFTIEQLQTKYSFIPWSNYLNKILFPHVHIDVHEEVIVYVPGFLEKLPDLLARTPKRTLANYIFWRLAQESVDQLSERVHKVYRNFMGNSRKRPRWQDCVDSVTENINLATSALFVRKHFHQKIKESTFEMIQNIRESFHRLLTNVLWLDEKTKEAALEKLEHIIPLVAYPPEYLDDEKLNEYYTDMKVYPENFLKTVLSSNLFYYEKMFQTLRRPVIKTDWTNFLTVVVNAYYVRSKNTIILPAGILQGEFFNVDNPKYMNYAGIGSVIGHELTHSFDNYGSQFDKEGNLMDWWSPKTKKEYLRRTRCIVDQYRNYTVGEVGLQLNGTQTLNENISDNGGIKVAYFGYNAMERKNGVEPLLPGLESYTTKQMFWIAYAHIWCAKYKPEYLKNFIATDAHTPNEYRVNGPISNMPEFSQDFHCPFGSAMNPIKKCTVF